MKAKLRVVGGRANRQEIVLSLATIVGRAKDSGLCVRHPTVSRKHCELREEGGLLVVEDLGSSNGIAVGDQVVPRATLRPGDRVTIGPLTFEAHYQVNGASRETATPPVAAAPAALLADTEVESDFDFLGDDAEIGLAPADEAPVAELPIAEAAALDVQAPDQELELEEEFALGDLDLADSDPAPAPQSAPAESAELELDELELEGGFDLAPIDELPGAPATAEPPAAADEAPDEFGLPDEFALDEELDLKLGGDDDLDLSDASPQARAEQAPGESGLKLHETLEFDLDDEEPAALSAVGDESPRAAKAKAQPESKSAPKPKPAAPPAADEGTLDGLDDWLGLSDE